MADNGGGRRERAGRAPGVARVGEVCTRAEFGQLLEHLRARRGRSLRDLAGEISRTGEEPIGPSAVGDWCRGARLPLPSRYDAFRRLLQLLGVRDTEPWIDTVVRLRAARRPRVGPERPPYVGLRSFGRDDADLFFGRRELVEETFARFCQVRDDGVRPRMLWVVGPSGAGKSSLLHAGLGPALEAEGFTCVSLTPGERPADRLAAAVARLAPSDGQVGSVVVVDQFEELFRTCEDESQRQAFLAALGSLTDPAGPPDATPHGGGCVVVAGLRIDFYAQVADHEPLLPSLQDAQILVGPLDLAQLRESIVEPARRVGVSIDDQLVSVLLRDFVPSGATGGLHDPGSLPLLAHALHETWTRRAGSDRMTVDDYDAAGGIGGTIENAAERVYEQLDRDDQELAKQVFLRLVHVAGEGAVSRRAAAHVELEGLGDATGRVRARHVVDQFVDARLLTAGRSTVEIVHESLLAHWPRLRGWIDADREALRAHRRITDATQTWVDSDRDPSSLASGARLEAMQSWADRSALSVRLNQDERIFLEASRAQAAETERAKRRQDRRLRVLAGVAASLALLASALVVVVNRARTDATTARDEALSRQTALNAEQLRVTDPGLAAQLAVAGYAISPTVEARSAVLSFATLPTAVRHLGGEGPTALAVHHDGAVVAVSNAADGTVELLQRRGGRASRGRREGRVREVGSVDVGTDAVIHALAFTPDGATLFTGDTASKIKAWDTSDPAKPRARGEIPGGPAGTVEHLAVSPDGAQLLAAGLGEGAYRWDIGDPVAPRALPPLPSRSATWSAVYSPDGRHVAVSNEIGQVELWDLAGTPRRLSLLEPTDQPVFTVAFSADGRLLAAGSQDSRLRVWDVSRPSEPRALVVAGNRFDSWVNTVAFSPDGRYVLAGSSDLSLRVWARHGSSWAPAATLPHPAELRSAGFVDGGRTVLSVATDGTTRWWDLSRAWRPQVDGRAWGVSFDRAGRRLAMVSNNEARLWDLSSGWSAPNLLARTAVSELDGAGDGFSGAGVLSPDGTRLAIGTRATGEVYVVDLSDPRRPRLAAPPLGDAHELVESVAFSPDGTVLAAGGDDTDVRLWTLGSEQGSTLVTHLRDPADFVYSVTFSPDGRYLAVASADSVVYLYDVADVRNPRLVADLDGLETEAYMAAFSPDGDVLATAGSDGVVVLWDITDPESPRRSGSPLTGPEARIFDLAFNTTGRYLAAAAADGSTWLWETADLRDISRWAVLGPAEAAIYQVEFDPASGMLTASGADGQLFVWPPDVDQVIADICATAGDGITRREWQLYLPAIPYDPPCDEESTP